ncbi:MAG TPA: glycosyltransferase family 39 protein [Steroidobacteraceae bacterium]|nr:glycosyltransferase family 39 protein [Steroidobacteraceae bacterium]
MSEPTRAPPAVLIALAAITLVACGLAASTWSVFGHTWDEPEHLAAGMALLDRGHYDFDIQHPPLARLALALGPYLAGARSQGIPPPDGKGEGIAILYGSGHYDRYLTLARAGALPFLALLVIMTYAFARLILSRPGSLLAAGFVATTPVVLGHGALATLDVPGAATCLLALYAVQRWLRTGRLRDALWLGLATGLAVGTKLSAVPFVALGALALAGVSILDRSAHAATPAPAPRLWKWTGGLLVAGLATAVVLTAAYGGRFIYLTDETGRYNQALGYLFGYAGPMHDAAYAVGARVKVPEAFQLIVGGIEALSVHNHSGHSSFLLGEVRNQGWWYFYPVALAVKTPLPLLLLGLPGLALLARDGIRAPDAMRLAPPVLFVVVLAFCSLYSHINIGVRHVLVLYPLLAVGAAALGVRVWGRIRARPAGAARGAASAVLGALLLWQAVVIVRSWPDYLPYFNELVGEPRLVLVDSDLDWGQDFRRLTARLAALHVPAVSLAYLGTADLAREPLPPYVRLKADEHATGWVAVSALARVHAPKRFDWLDAYRPRERIGTSIDLYFVPPPPRSP